MRTWDDYFIPGSQVLRNRFVSDGKPFGETDPERLRQLEAAFTRSRMEELCHQPVSGQFDYDHMKAIHHFIFQDVYDWAGEERTAPVDSWMVKDGYRYYPAGPVLTAAAEEQYKKIADANYLRGLEKDEFVAELGERWGEINVVHSFREGNTRTQCVFFAYLAKQAGFYLPITAFAQGKQHRDDFVRARYHGQAKADNSLLAAVLAKVIIPRSDETSQ